jgi:Phosphotransferase enzyme family
VTLPSGTVGQYVHQDSLHGEKKLTKDNAISQRVLQEVLSALIPGVKVSSEAVTILNMNRNIARTLFHIRIGPDSRDRQIFVKVFDDPRKTLEQRIELAETENRFHQCARRRFSSVNSLGVPPLIGPFPGQPVVVVEKVKGILLSRLLSHAVWKSAFTADDSKVENTLERVGEWLRVFHDEENSVLRPVTPESVLAAVLREFDRLPTPPYDATLRSKVEKFCFRSLERTTVRELPIVPQHGDFLPHNIIVDGEKVFGLDFNSTRLDAGLQDLSNFIAYLELFRKLPICSRRAIERWRASFLGGYGQSGWDGPLLRVFVLRCTLALLHESIRYKTLARGLISRHVARTLATLEGE